MKRYRLVATFRCESEECANRIQEGIKAIAGEAGAAEVRVEMREEIYRDIVLPQSSSCAESPTAMDYDEIFEPTVL